MTNAPATAEESGAKRPHSKVTLAVLTLVGIALFLSFLALGTWQVQRRTWKLDLMERVDQRLHATPAALPPTSQWPQVDATGYEYLPVHAQGQWLLDKTLLSQAVTELGAGFWVMTPLQQADGTQVLINRGYLPTEQRAAWLANPVNTAPSTNPVQVEGLMRMSEPHGGFLRTNDPAAQRWHSRDIPAMAAALGLPNAAPFFIDAGLPRAKPPTSVVATGWPRAGMTVVGFHNSHAVYALTWYSLALMVAGAAFYVVRYERRLRASVRQHHHEQHH